MLTRRKDETVFQYWISFWPVAPVFGVPWRFEAMAPGAAFFRPSAVAAEMAAGAAAETGRAVQETAPAADAAPEAVVEAAETAAEAADRAATEDAALSETATPVGSPALKPAALYSEPPSETDDLKKIKGVGPKLEALLNDLGIYRYEQIAGFSESDLAWIDEHLTTFKGRPLRDDWPAQARDLM